MVRIVCGNCATIGKYETFTAAEKDGWDTVLTFGYNSCPKCPGVSVYFPMYFCQLARMEENVDTKMTLLKQAAEATMEFAPKEKDEEVQEAQAGREEGNLEEEQEVTPH